MSDDKPQILLSTKVAFQSGVLLHRKALNGGLASSSISPAQYKFIALTLCRT